MSRTRLYEDGEVIYTFVKKGDSKQYTEDSFLSAYAQIKKRSETAAKEMLDKFKVFKNGTEIPMEEYFKESKSAKRVSVSRDTTKPLDLTLPVKKTSDGTTPSGDDAKTSETTTPTPAPTDGTDSTDAKTTPTAAGAITDKTVDQLISLIDNIGVTVYDKNTHKKVTTTKMDGRSLNDYVIYLGGKNPISIRAWIKRLREKGVLTESFLEDFTADEMTKSGVIYLYMNISFDNEDAEFTLDVDEIGQIVITPNDEGVSFDGVSILTPNGEGVFVSVDNDETVQGPTVAINYTMTSSENDYNFFTSIDDIGQSIITPENDNSSFVSATVGDNLNIAAEDEEIQLMESIESVLAKLRQDTENYTTINGEISADTIEDADTIRTALEMYYDNVDIKEDGDSFVVSYSDNDPEIVETLTEDGVDEEDMPEWKVSYKFADDIEQDGETAGTVVNAETSEDANKFGEQYARQMALDDDKWKNAKIISLQLVK